MARLPQPGSDNGTWGYILNDYLSQALQPNGLLKDNAVTANTIAPNAVTNAAIASDAVNSTSIADGSITNALIVDGTIAEVKLASAVQTKLNASATPDATASVKGKIQLTGDLGGTAASPTVAQLNGVVINGTPANGNVLTATSTTAASWSAPASAPVSSVAGKIGAVTLDKSDVGLGSVDNTSDTNKPVSAATQTALNAKADDSTVVHKTGNEMVAGVKSFSSAPKLTSSSATGQVWTATGTDGSGNWTTPTSGISEELALAYSVAL